MVSKDRDTIPDELQFESIRNGLPPRVSKRPDPAQWNDEELMSFREAAALFWPEGPLGVSSLRSAHRNGQLAAAEIAGKLLTTKASIKEMVRTGLRVRRPHDPPTEDALRAPLVSKPARDDLRAKIVTAIAKG